LCVFDPICGRALAIEHNGDLFSCDHYVEQRYRLGNIHKSSMVQLVGSAKQQQFGMEKRTSLPQYCLDCEVLFACNGGCPKNRIRHTPAGEYGLNYLCQGYRKFFNYINQPMRDMAARFPR
ncbi:MAG: SPASM domain-containing protein, partial [Anaerolineales bacterium]